ncbi:sulfotransferase family protein [Aestuariivivens sediminicola]|uniref:sulfotransferase family protein n=1 Tax=Aestuariivivens sediminicola TaxID=2913560 RepID=UPI001F5A0000|nr:sulfotransferase [Aestuariivivens sediminicola]
MSTLIQFIKLVVKDGLSIRKISHLIHYIFLRLTSIPLNLVESLIYSRKISKHRIIHPPIFILGHWRTGTSFLHQLLIQDKRFGYLNYYQVIFFGSFLWTERFLKPILQFVAVTLKLKVPFFNNAPFDWDLPCEEDTALLNKNGNNSSYLAYLFPKHAKYWFNRNMLMADCSEEQINNWSRCYLNLLKKISYKNRGRQLLLKTPPNLARVPLLIKFFPNAKFIFIDRHPKEVFRSHLKLWQSNIDHFSLQSVAEHELRDLILGTYDKMMAKFEKDKEIIKSSHFMEIIYDELTEHPVQIINTIYSKLKLSDFEQLREVFESYVENNSSYKPFTYNSQLHLESNEKIILKYYAKKFNHKKKRKLNLKIEPKI